MSRKLRLAVQLEGVPLYGDTRDVDSQGLAAPMRNCTSHKGHGTGIT